MIVGIYALSFNGTDKVYIGKSTDISRRKAAHKREMVQNKHHSYKVQEAYNLYGECTFTILETCKESDLLKLESAWMEEFDSINNGLNVISNSKDSTGSGINAAGSIYTEEQITQAFLMLVDVSAISTMKISTDSGIAFGTIGHIARGDVHNHWLQLKYPEEYQLLKEVNKIRLIKENKTTSVSKGIIHPTIISPEGVEFQVTNIREFARDNNLNQGHLGAVLRGRELTHKGWKIKENQIKYTAATKVYGSLICPQGQVYLDIADISKFARDHGLRKDSLSKVLLGQQVQHKGWSIHNGS